MEIFNIFLRNIKCRRRLALSIANVRTLITRYPLNKRHRQRLLRLGIELDHERDYGDFVLDQWNPMESQ